MHPILLRRGPFVLGAYSAMLALSFLLGILLASRRARSRGMHPDVIVDVGLIALATALAGARLLHLALHPEQISSWRSVLDLSQGGLSMYGGVLAAIGACWLYARWRRMAFLRLADVVAPSLALGLGVTRIGCFLNGCCYGRPTSGPFGVVFPPGSHAAAEFGQTPLHPTQLYTSLIGFCILFALLLLERRYQGMGQLFGLYLVLEGIGRVAMDFVRAYEPRAYLLPGITAHQSIAAWLVASGLLLLARGGRSGKLAEPAL